METGETDETSEHACFPGGVPMLTLLTAIALCLLAFVTGYAAAMDRWGVVCVLVASGAVLAVVHAWAARAGL